MKQYGEGKKTYLIPVEATYWSKVAIQADSLREAVEYVISNINSIEIPEDMEYIEDTFNIVDSDSTIDEITQCIEEVYEYGLGLESYKD